jgi:hypothetical protein
VFFAAFESVASAKPKNHAANSKAAAAKAAADAAAKKQADDKHAQLAQGFYNDLHDVCPNLTVDELKGMSSADIRNLYFHSYVAKGAGFSDARSKAGTLKIWDAN